MERLKVMRNLCEVLEINFWEKMEELDIDPQSEAMDGEALRRVNITIELLENTKRSRFLKIKELGLRLIELRSLMIDQEIDFADVLCFTDAASENEITQEKALSSRVLNKVKCKVSKLEELRGNRLREKNMRVKTKIRELLKSTHLTGNEIEIDLEQEVLEELKVQKETLKMVLQRRLDIIIRTEVWRKLTDQLKTLQNRCKNTKKMELKKCELLLSKRIQGIQNILLERVEAWEKQYGFPFFYDGDHLLTLLGKNNDAEASSSEGQVPAQDLLSLLTKLLTQSFVARQGCLCHLKNMCLGSYAYMCLHLFFLYHPLVHHLQWLNQFRSRLLYYLCLMYHCRLVHHHP